MCHGLNLHQSVKCITIRRVLNRARAFLLPFLMERHMGQRSILLTEKRCVEIHDRLARDDSPIACHAKRSRSRVSARLND